NTLIISIIRISFGLSKEIVALSIVKIETYFRTITFYILPINIPFLLYLKNIDRLGIIFDNIKRIKKRSKKKRLNKRTRGRIIPLIIVSKLIKKRKS
ncbi:uncharacterized protein CLUP02_14592, partial [Colletotrichum lupini]